MPDDLKRLTISGFKRIADENARAEWESNSGDDPDALASWGSTLVAIRYILEHGVPESLKDEGTR